MKLDQPIETYLTGDNPTHTPLSRLSLHAKAWTQEEIVDMFTIAGYLDMDGKVTKHAVQSHLVDTCGGKVLWNLLESKKAIIAQHRIREQARGAQEAARLKKLEDREPKWVDLGTVGTYFGASAVMIGRWLDMLGLRVIQKMDTNESGAVDMLDVARAKQSEQQGQFISKKPSDKAFDSGLARILTVTNHKKKEVEITQWNLELCKAVLVRSGHELDTERKMTLKGKGKNSDVKVITIDDRAKEIYGNWRKLYNDPTTRKSSWDVFNKQPKPILLKIEALMNRPGFITEKRWLKENF